MEIKVVAVEGVSSAMAPQSCGWRHTRRAWNRRAVTLQPKTCLFWASVLACAISTVSCAAQPAPESSAVSAQVDGQMAASAPVRISVPVPVPVPLAGAAQRFVIGNATVWSLRDAVDVLDNDGRVFGLDQDAGAAAVAKVLRDAGQPTDSIVLSVDALLIERSDRVMLFDTGLGFRVHGALPSSMAKAGISADQVTDIFITHAHLDHVGGLSGPDGRSSFPRATIHLSRPEWQWMRDQERTQGIARVISDKVRTFEPGDVVIPGVTAVALPGHTPGHSGYDIDLGSQHLLDLGDTVHSVTLSLGRPDWAIGWDGDRDLGRASRKTILSEVARHRTTVFAPHFPFPGIGRIEAAHDGYAWIPLASPRP